MLRASGVALIQNYPHFDLLERRNGGAVPVSRFSHLLLSVWREACRHTEIGDALGDAAPDLFRRLPVDLIVVRRLDPTRRSIETVATGVCRPSPLPVELRQELGEGSW